MGQQTSRPIHRSQTELLPLSQLSYHRTCRLPGDPFLLPGNSLPSSIKNLISAAEVPEFIECYSVELRCSQEQIVLQQKIYSERKKSLPWHVRVLGWQLQKSPCYCADSKLKGNIYLEHVETRLVNFRISQNNALHIHSEEEILESFTLCQSIYVLINALQGYRFLCEQSRVSYPSIYSIGINSKGQVKVWLSENWALNYQGSKNIPINLLIEQIISLISQRTSGNLQDLLKERYNYLSFNFDSIQQLLGQYAIEFNKGRRSLEERIRFKLQERRNKSLNRNKYSLNKNQNCSQENQAKSQMGRSFILQKSTQKVEHLPSEKPARIQFSIVQQGPWINQQQLNVQRMVLAKPSHTPSSTANSSPIKTIRFTYEHSHSPYRPPSPKPSLPSTFCRFTDSLPGQSSLHSHQFSNPYSLISQRQNSSPVIARQNYQINFSSQKGGKFNALEEQLIIKKLNLDPNQADSLKNIKLNPPPNLGQQSYITSTIEEVESKKTLKKANEKISFQAYPPDTHTISFLLEETPPSSKRDQKGFEMKTPEAKPETLSQLTSEFRLLLKSEKRMDNEQERLSIQSYTDLLHSISNSESVQCEDEEVFYQKEDPFPSNILERNIYAIKQVDEDVSYSIDQNK